MERWLGRVALVTGASSGIGYNLAEKLAGHGVKVVGCARNTDKIQELSSRLAEAKSPGLVHAIRCDLSKEDDITEMFAAIKEEFGGVDICVNNAGVGHEATLLDGETAKFRSMLEVNVLALTICTRNAVQSMRERGVDDGHVVHVSSGAAYGFPPGYDATFYSATKSAVRALTEGLRGELRMRKSKIRVSSISPGLTETDFAVRMRGDKGKEIYQTKPVLKAEDVVDSIIHLLAAPPHVQIHDILMRPTESLY